MPDPAPDPILEAAAQAIAAGGYLGCLCCYRDSDPHPVWAEDREHLGPRPVWQEDRETAAAVLAVARPLIEAETRERIAEDIEAHAQAYGIGYAAAIARGANTGHEQEPVK
jgi:hypothetical protein